ncbi:PTS glucose transporter subunit IIA [Brevibacillus sp. TJ4]|uniref:PTS sugar transporter subunit IIA n=1 Tax=Brevibacillus sp. TJ4 TaxID=3234853 RepID=UPI0037D6F8FE
MPNFFTRNKNQQVTLLAPLTGSVIPLTEVPDPVFSQKMMGDGIAILPTEGLLVAPTDGVVSHLFPTHHAIVINSIDGLDILLHIGIDTVNAKGNGFLPHVSTNSQVKAGDPLISFDLDTLQTFGCPLVTPIVIANSERVDHMQRSDHKTVNAGLHPLMTLRLKP